MSENELAKLVLDSAFTVHTKLGPGLLESVYEVVLAHELRKSGVSVERQKPMPITYDGIRFEEAYRADLVVGEKLIVELKSVAATSPVHRQTTPHSASSERPPARTAYQLRRKSFEEWNPAGHQRTT
jgi:GxxExxY protein